MGKRALYGALMGASQGLAQYGDSLRADALRARSDERIASRQHSLQMISQQFQNGQRIMRQNFQNNQRIAGQKFQTDMRDDERRYQEGREADMLDPNSDLYQIEQEKLRRQKELRAVNPYATNTSAINNYEFYAGLSEEERAVYDWVNKISNKGAGLTDEQKQKAVLDLMTAFYKKDDFEQASSLERLGIDPNAEPEIIQQQLMQHFMGMVNNVAGTQSASLMPGGTGVPGGSRENPIDVTTLSEAPPSGTWVRLPNGQVKQMP